MTALTASRDFERVTPNPGDHASYGVPASTRIYQGSLLMNAAGLATSVAAAGSFLGVATEEVDNVEGAADAERVETMVDGVLSNLKIAGSPAIGAAVYCATDNIADLTTVSTGATRIGVIRQKNPDGTWDVRLQTIANGQVSLI